MLRILIVTENWGVGSSQNNFTVYILAFLVLKLRSSEHVTLCRPINSCRRFEGSYCLHLQVNPLKPELNPIGYFLALLGAHHFLHISRIRVK